MKRLVLLATLVALSLAPCAHAQFGWGSSSTQPSPAMPCNRSCKERS